MDALSVPEDFGMEERCNELTEIEVPTVEATSDITPTLPNMSCLTEAPEVELTVKLDSPLFEGSKDHAIPNSSQNETPVNAESLNTAEEAAGTITEEESHQFSQSPSSVVEDDTKREESVEIIKSEQQGATENSFEETMGSSENTTEEPALSNSDEARRKSTDKTSAAGRLFGFFTRKD